MNPDPREPTPDELLTMAFVDGELDGTARSTFEARMASDPALAREVAAELRLAVLARSARPREPQDAVWQRLAADPLHRHGGRLSLVLLGAGMLLLAGALVVALCISDLGVLAKTASLCVLAGLLLAFLVTLRARLRTLAYDPYRHVER